MANPSLGFDPATNGLGKPAKGSGYMKAKDRRADRRNSEQKEMQAALDRDKRRCRWPGCKGTYRGLSLPIDPCHFIEHRGPGGNPDGTRTRKDLIVALCRNCHTLLDSHQREIQPLSDLNADGLLSFHVRNEESGVMEHIASETARGVSVAVGA